MSGIGQVPVTSDQGGLSGVSDPKPPVVRPRAYQAAAIAAVIAVLLMVRSCLLVAATGTGKTVMFAELARLEVQQGGRVLILVHRDELIRQARRKCEAVGLYPDVEKGKERAGKFAKVVIASVQSMRGARLTRWARSHFTKIIVDEAHHAAAKSYQEVLSHFLEAKVVGVTATPARADGKPLGDTFETVAFTYDIRKAIDDQWLVPIVARRVVVDSIDLRDVGTRAGDFAQDQLAEVMANERALRGVAVPLLELARDRPTIAFCVNVKHAVDLARVLNSMRYGCARAVSGETDDDERERILAAHTAGEFQFLVNCDLLVEGYDSPAVSCVAMCRPTQSWGRFVQCAGRGLRLLGETYAQSVANGKRDCLLLDFTGATKHTLIGPADCLAGPDEIPDDVREEIERQLATAQLEISKVIAHAHDEVTKRRAAMKLAAVVKYHAEFVDPFLGPDAVPVVVPRPEMEDERPSQAQLEKLEEHGVTTSHLPKEFSKADAYRLLSRVMGNDKRAERGEGPGSYLQLRRLAISGVRAPHKLTADRVRQLIGKLAAAGWHKSAIAREPECRDAFPLRTERAS